MRLHNEQISKQHRVVNEALNGQTTAPSSLEYDVYQNNAPQPVFYDQENQCKDFKIFVKVDSLDPQNAGYQNNYMMSRPDMMENQIPDYKPESDYMPVVDSDSD